MIFFVHSLFKLHNLNAYRTDGEPALLSALVINFPIATGLRCYLHKQRNIKDKLHNKFKVGTDVKREIIKDIFRDYGDWVFSTALIDAENVEEFDSELASFQEEWESVIPGFHS